MLGVHHLSGASGMNTKGSDVCMIQCGEAVSPFKTGDLCLYVYIIIYMYITIQKNIYVPVYFYIKSKKIDKIVLKGKQAS